MDAKEIKGDFIINKDNPLIQLGECSFAELIFRRLAEVRGSYSRCELSSSGYVDIKKGFAFVSYKLRPEVQ